MNSELETEMYVLMVVDMICSIRPVLKPSAYKFSTSLTSATSSGQLAAGVQQREAISRDTAWLFTEERSVQRKGCVAHEQCRLAHMILGITPSLLLILEYISEGEPSEVTKVSVHGDWERGKSKTTPFIQTFISPETIA